MPSYRRAHQPGGTFFFTVVTDGRAPLFADPTARRLLRSAIEDARAARPFAIDALVLLPEHFHILLTLPPEDADYATRVAHLKTLFTRSFLEASPDREQTRSTYRRRTRAAASGSPATGNIAFATPKITGITTITSTTTPSSTSTAPARISGPTHVPPRHPLPPLPARLVMRLQ